MNFNHLCEILFPDYFDDEECIHNNFYIKFRNKDQDNQYNQLIFRKTQEGYYFYDRVINNPVSNYISKQQQQHKKYESFSVDKWRVFIDLNHPNSIKDIEKFIKYYEQR